MAAPYDLPLPTTRAPAPPARGNTLARRTTQGASGVGRSKTLTRPERHVAPAPLIAPTVPKSSLSPTSTTGGLTPWVVTSYVFTFWAPPALLRAMGIKDPATQQAWREKIALCAICMILAGIVGFLTMGIDRVLCPTSQGRTASQFKRLRDTDNVVGIDGWQFNVTNSKPKGGINFLDFAGESAGQDMTTYFERPASTMSSCTNKTAAYSSIDLCSKTGSCQLGTLDAATLSSLGLENTTYLVGYDWGIVANLSNYMVIDGTVLNMEPYMTIKPYPVKNDLVDVAIRRVLNEMDRKGGRDATMLFYSRTYLREAVPCLIERYKAGHIDHITPGCFVSQLFLYCALVIILGVVLARFAMACVFNWFLSARLIIPPKDLNRRVVSPAVMPEGANISVNNLTGTAPWAAHGGVSASGRNKLSRGKPLAPPGGGGGAPAPVISKAQIGAELFVICLITCYSEGEDGIKATLDSLSASDYSDQRKLLFVVADGMITGAGEKRSTPDICVGLLEADSRFGNPMPMSYDSIGAGKKAENRAMIYAGHYVCNGHRTPTIIVVKCGTAEEAVHDRKPGNRGKRDSQLILMNFFSRVTYNDRMSPLDYDLFRKVHTLMGVTPDYFEVCLMVDADTKVFPDSVTHLVNCMQHDNNIMGVCGETRIENKRQSWVTMIQVFEYYISHHLAKGFESVFGGVTCLPGCFSMFRLKARKANDDDWVPLIIKPEIVREYSQSVVATLHQKNLLLLGEDRFLTTILIRTFPNRKMMFCPHARCRTVVPDTFSMLLSQRRRWINSTVHNLMELVLVRNLCGTFCFSMQFVVFMDLLGTVVLPIAICLTFALIVNSIITPPKSFGDAIPLMLLAAVLGLPAILILLTTRKLVYVAWMVIYLIALPIWNFVLPVYAFWHFDDFSWGETRKVEGEGKDTGHGSDKPELETVQVPLRRWEDWERSRLRKLKRDEKRRKEFEKAFGRQGFHNDSGYAASEDGLTSRSRSEYGESDTLSVGSYEDDRWGADIGAYNENNPAYPPPPATLNPSPQIVQHAPGRQIHQADLDAMLEEGFDDSRPESQFFPPGAHPHAPPPLITATSPGTGQYDLHDSYPIPRPYSPSESRMPLAHSSAINESVAGGNGHVRQRSGGPAVGAGRGSDDSPPPGSEWGPLGPLGRDERGPGRPR